MNKNYKNILVIGGAGYIGAHTCKILKKYDYNPITYDNLIFGHKDYVKWGPFEYGDIHDENKLEIILNKYKPQAVFHFAGFGYVGESVINPDKYYYNNVSGSISLLKAMKKTNINKIIFSSTCATFGIPKTIPISEKENQKPTHPYGQSKLMIEKILNDFDKAFGIKNIILRYFNAAGADPEGQIGENHYPECHLIPLILDVALGRKSEITIFGNNYKTPDGTCIRDYIHVTDLALGHLLALKYLNKSKKSDDFNLGQGDGFSVKQIISIIEQITGKKISQKIAPKRKGDPPILIANSKKAQKKLGWIPKYSQIDVIIKHAWKWHVKNFEEIRICNEQNKIRSKSSCI